MELGDALIIGAATIAAALIGVYVGNRPPKADPDISSAPEATKRFHRYDVFISAPLASYSTDAEIQADHDRIAPVVEYLEKELGFKVFWAGRNIRSKADFDAPDLSAETDVKAITDSKYYHVVLSQRGCV